MVIESDVAINPMINTACSTTMLDIIETICHYIQ